MVAEEKYQSSSTMDLKDGRSRVSSSLVKRDMRLVGDLGTAGVGKGYVTHGALREGFSSFQDEPLM